MSNPIAMLMCPTCKRSFPSTPLRDSMPFCCQKCQLIDLGRWLDEEIGLPHEASDEDKEAESAPPVVREWRFE
jgi:hypothetical protein